MATYGFTAIPDDQIKIKWQEPYVSAGLNKKMQGTVLKGVYRGFDVTEDSPTGESILVNVDGATNDSVAVVEDSADGYSNTVYFDSSFAVDLSSLFPVGGAITLYVIIEVDYDIGTTTGNVKVVDAAELGSLDPYILVAKIDVPGAATEILNAYITQVGKTDAADPSATDRPWVSSTEHGLMYPEAFDRLPNQDQKDAMDAADTPSAANEFVTASFFQGEFQEYGGLTVRMASKVLADDDSFTIEADTAGWGFVQIGQNVAHAHFVWDGDDNVTILHSSDSVIDSDTDNNLCIFGDGSNVAIKNRLNSDLTIRYALYYSDQGAAGGVTVASAPSAPSAPTTP